MLMLVATGKKPGDTWEHEVPTHPVTLGRHAGENLSDWAVPWDLRISRRHARLSLDGDQLAVERLEEGRNPIFFKGQEIAPSARFFVVSGEQFLIGDTTFELHDEITVSHADMPVPMGEVELGSAELKQLRFSDADERIEVLSSLPSIIRDAPGDADLEAQVIDVLLRGIPQAHTVGIVCHVDGPPPVVRLRGWKQRSKNDPQVKPSARASSTRPCARSYSVSWRSGSPATCGWSTLPPPVQIGPSVSPCVTTSRKAGAFTSPAATDSRWATSVTTS